MEPITVLVIEDDGEARESLSQLLKSWGHKTYSVGDGAAGLEMALRLRPQVVLSDINLPLLNGYEIARRLRLAFGRDILLIAQTGEDDLQREKAAGFDAHCDKPVNIGDLRTILEMVD